MSLLDIFADRRTHFVYFHIAFHVLFQPFLLYQEEQVLTQW